MNDKIYSISFTENENLAMEYVCFNVDDWIQNVCHERARIAIDQTFDDAVKEFLYRNEVMPGSKEEVIKLAFEREYLRKACVIPEENEDLMKSESSNGV